MSVIEMRGILIIGWLLGLFFIFYSLIALGRIWRYTKQSAGSLHVLEILLQNWHQTGLPRETRHQQELPPRPPTDDRLFVFCPGCKTKLEIPAVLVGTKIACPKCSTDTSALAKKGH